MADPAPRVPMRRMTINIMFTIFLTLVVYAIITLTLVMPQLRGQALQVKALSDQVASMQSQLNQMAASAEAAPAAAPAPEGAAAAAPAAPAAPADAAATAAK